MVHYNNAEKQEIKINTRLKKGISAIHLQTRILALHSNLLAQTVVAHHFNHLLNSALPPENEKSVWWGKQTRQRMFLVMQRQLKVLSKNNKTSQTGISITHHLGTASVKSSDAFNNATILLGGQSFYHKNWYHHLKWKCHCHNCQLRLLSLLRAFSCQKVSLHSLPTSTLHWKLHNKG